MDLCFVNVEQLKNFKIGSELKIELIGESINSYTNKRLRHYLVNGREVKFIQSKDQSNYTIKEEIQLIRKNIKATNDGLVFIKD